MRVRDLIQNLENSDPDCELFIRPPFDIYDYTLDEVEIEVVKKEGSEKVYIVLGTKEDDALKNIED